MRRTLPLLVLLGCGAPEPAVEGPVPEFSLPDVNASSARFDTQVSPRDLLERVSGWYFGHATWSYCSAQFGRLDELQGELEAAGLDVEILGVNQAGHESGNPSITDGRDLAWLQEAADHSVWDEWGVTYRDVWILDGDNELIEVYNLTEHDLEDPANFDALYDRFATAAGP